MIRQCLTETSGAGTTLNRMVAAGFAGDTGATAEANNTQVVAQRCKDSAPSLGAEE